MSSPERPDSTKDQGLATVHRDTLHRGLSARQVQMIAIAGTIGTGLFLGTGRSLAQGGPASILICYSIVGFIVYITLLLLGEMATQYPVAGSFNAYASRFFSPAYGFALSWNYWFNDAVSMASDLTAAQLVLQFWTTWNPWVVTVIFWVFLVSVNSFHVKAYGELATIAIFIIVGILVNVGVNTSHKYIGFHNWTIPGAPFVGGFGGFARVFVTASFAYGVTAGETRNPSRNMPRVVRFVFWRQVDLWTGSTCLIAYAFTHTHFLRSPPETTALFAGTRVLYGLSVLRPRRYAPQIFSRTTSTGVPVFALLATSSVSILCFGSSYIGSGQLWGWLQNIVGVSNQIAWLSIGLASWRFRKAWLLQRRPIEELKFRVSWTWPWGPYFVIVAVSALILVQGWTSIFPTFSPTDFVSFYIEIPVMAVMYIAWLIVKGTIPTGLSGNSLRPTGMSSSKIGLGAAFDIVDILTVDLHEDEYVEVSE
ncbi:amino acid permease-domain-containing protein [Pisolithus marmoratus]|nr:amino acid permease-domain-containing protein [Pisolithus marmoratus]